MPMSISTAFFFVCAVYVDLSFGITIRRVGRHLSLNCSAARAGRAPPCSGHLACGKLPSLTQIRFDAGYRRAMVSREPLVASTSLSRTQTFPSTSSPRRIAAAARSR